jgi:hypothetical protein
MIHHLHTEGRLGALSLVHQVNLSALAGSLSRHSCGLRNRVDWHYHFQLIQEQKASLAPLSRVSPIIAACQLRNCDDAQGCFPLAAVAGKLFEKTGNVELFAFRVAADADFRTTPKPEESMSDCAASDTVFQSIMQPH